MESAPDELNEMVILAISTKHGEQLEMCKKHFAIRDAEAVYGALQHVVSLVDLEKDSDIEFLFDAMRETILYQFHTHARLRSAQAEYIFQTMPSRPQ